MDLNTKQSIISFIDANKIFYLDWIRKNCDNYPFVCTQASDVLGSYIKAIYGEGVLVHGRFNCVDNEEMYVHSDYCEEPLFPFHSWLLYDDIIVDFTAFQFAGEDAFKWDEDKWYSEKNAEKYYNHILKRYQKSPIITRDNDLYSLYYPNKKYECRFTKYVKELSFFDYLENIKTQRSFTKYRYNRGLRKVRTAS